MTSDNELQYKVTKITLDLVWPAFRADRHEAK